MAHPKKVYVLMHLYFILFTENGSKLHLLHTKWNKLFLAYFSGFPLNISEKQVSFKNVLIRKRDTTLSPLGDEILVNFQESIYGPDLVKHLRMHLTFTES